MPGDALTEARVPTFFPSMTMTCAEQIFPSLIIILHRINCDQISMVADSLDVALTYLGRPEHAVSTEVNAAMKNLILFEFTLDL